MTNGRTAGRCRLLLLALGIGAGLHLEPGIDAAPKYSIPDEARRIENVSRARSLLFVPLRNRTGDADLNYLAYGVPALLFSDMRTFFLVEGSPLTQKRLTPGGFLAETEIPSQTPSIVFLKAALLDFRKTAIRERQKGIPEANSALPAKERELLTGDAADVALKYGAHWFVEGSMEYEPVPEAVYVDPKGNRIVITPEVRAQFAGKEVPRALAKLLREQTPQWVIVRISLRSFERGRDVVLWSDTFRLSVKNPYEGVDFAPSARRLEEAIRRENPHVLRLRSSKTPGYAFLNDTFVGKTPVDLRVPRGTMSLRIEQDGCNHFRQQLTFPGSTTDIVAPCDVFRGRASLSVLSEPAGADVYLDHEWIGKTPVKRQDLAPGVHRVRVSMKGYVDGFYGVQLGQDHPTDVVADLKKGDTVAYYTDPGYAIMDWTYDDLSFGFLVHSLFGYAGWRYGTVRANAERDSIRGPLIPSFLPQSSYGYVEYRMLEDARLRALTWERAGKGMAAVGIGSLMAAGYYLYRSLDHDERPFGELPDSASRMQWMLAPLPYSREEGRSAFGFGLSLSF